MSYLTIETPDSTIRRQLDSVDASEPQRAYMLAKAAHETAKDHEKLLVAAIALAEPSSQELDAWCAETGRSLGEALFGVNDAREYDVNLCHPYYKARHETEEKAGTSQFSWLRIQAENCLVEWAKEGEGGNSANGSHRFGKRSKRGRYTARCGKSCWTSVCGCLRVARRWRVAKTGAHLRIVNDGTNSMKVVLEGDKRKPEPDSFRVEFPGGQVDIERCSDGSYWVHVLANEREKTIDREGPDSGTVYGRFSEARMHMNGKNTSEADLGDFENPGLYDVALRVVRS